MSATIKRIPRSARPMSIYFPSAIILFSATTVRAARIALTLYALELGSTTFAIGVLGATFAIPMLLCWISGRLSDRFGAQWPLVCGAICAALGLLLPYFNPYLWAVFVAAALIGLSQALYSVPLQNLVGLMSDQSNRARNFATFSMAVSVANSIGPLLAGVAIDRFGYSTALLSIVVISLVPLALIAGGNKLLKGKQSETPAQGIRATLAIPGMWRVLAASAIAQSGLDLFLVYMPVYGHSIGLSASAIGVVLAMLAVAGFISRLVLPWLISLANDEKVLAYAFWLGAISYLAVPFFQSTLMLSLCAFCFGFGINLSQPITMMLAFALSPPGRSGETLGVRMTTDNLTKLICPVLYGSFAVVAGLAAVFWLSALMLGSGAIFSNPKKTTLDV